MARAYSNRLGVNFATVDKNRISPEVVESDTIIGEVKGKNILLIDDLIATGGSIIAAGDLLKSKGAEKIYVCASHGVLCGQAIEKLNNAVSIEEVVVSDTIPHEKLPPKFKILSVAKMISDAILRIHTNRSVSALFHQVSYK
jgi:ribose-phosphate pyrophosphokinase